MVIESEDGLTVVPHDAEYDPAETAAKHNGLLTDRELYKSYDDAYDALLALKLEEEADERSAD